MCNGASYHSCHRFSKYVSGFLPWLSFLHFFAFFFDVHPLSFVLLLCNISVAGFVLSVCFFFFFTFELKRSLRQIDTHHSFTGYEKVKYRRKSN